MLYRDGNSYFHGYEFATKTGFGGNTSEATSPNGAKIVKPGAYDSYFVLGNLVITKNGVVSGGKITGISTNMSSMADANQTSNFQTFSNYSGNIQCYCILFKINSR